MLTEEDTDRKKLDLKGFTLVELVVVIAVLALQDRKIWESFLEKEVILRSNSTELYFEEYDLDAFVEKLERLYPRIQYVNKLMTLSWGQKVVRFYDPDGNLIEVRTSA